MDAFIALTAMAADLARWFSHGILGGASSMQPSQSPEK